MTRRTVLALGGVAATIPASARAHLNDNGLGPVYDGLAHPFLAPTQLSPVVALSILAALAGRAHGRALIATLPATWLVGGLGGLSLTREPDVALPVAVLTCGLGLLGAGDVRVSTWAFAVVAGGVGLALGALDGAAIEVAGRGASSLFGIAVAVAAAVTIVAGHGLKLDVGARRLSLRVGASWIAAISLLSVGWSLQRAHADL